MLGELDAMSKVLRPYWMPQHRRWAMQAGPHAASWLLDGRAGLLNLLWACREDQDLTAWVKSMGCRLKLNHVSLEELAALNTPKVFIAKTNFSNLPPQLVALRIVLSRSLHADP